MNVLIGRGLLLFKPIIISISFICFAPKSCEELYHKTHSKSRD